VLLGIVNGQARRIVKPGQVFNRIHVADIAQSIDAAFARKPNGIFNVADDDPAPPQDVIAFAADLLGRPRPPELSFGQAEGSLSAMARSFYADNRRVRNLKLKRELGIALEFPTYREGLRSLAASGDFRSGDIIGNPTPRE
jgi:hypothetical protein